MTWLNCICTVHTVIKLNGSQLSTLSVDIDIDIVLLLKVIGICGIGQVVVSFTA